MFALGFASAGCGGEDPIRGRLSVNGKPVTDGMVVFIPAGKDVGIRGFGQLDGRGRFEIQSNQPTGGIPAGRYSIYIRPPSVASAKKGEKDVPASYPVPAKYLSPEAPLIQVDYEGEPMRLDLNLN